MAMNTLNDRLVAELKPEAKERKFFDAGVLYVAVKPTGRKIWRMAYRFKGIPRTLTIGEYLVVSLKETREKRHEAKVQLDNGVDPSKRKWVANESGRNSLSMIAEEWFEKHKSGWTPNHAGDI